MNEKLKHTPGRLRMVNDCGEWSASHDGDGTSCYQGLKSEDGIIVALAVAHDAEPFGDPDTRESARRLAACWNACDGISTDALEKGRLSADAFQLEESRGDLAERQRDDLLEALELADCLLSGANMNKSVVERKVRAAIAKATGKTSEAV